MATPEASPTEPPQWQYDEFNSRMQQWIAELIEIATYGGAGMSEESLPEELKCFTQNPKAAFHFESFVRLLMIWYGESPGERLDWATWVTASERNVYARLKHLIITMERDFDEGKFKSRTCAMEVREMERICTGSIQDRGANSKVFPNSPLNHISILTNTLKDDNQSRWWALYCVPYWNIYLALAETSTGLKTLLSRYEEGNKAQEATIVPSDGSTGAEQGKKSVNSSVQFMYTDSMKVCLRRRRPDTQTRDPSPRSIPQSPVEDTKDHTPTEALLLLTRALNAAFHQIPFSELREALWAAERAPVALSLIVTSISSVLIGVAITMHSSFDYSHIDEDFFTLLSDTILQLFSLYILLLPFLRGQEPHIRGIWFCLSIGVSVVFSVVSCIVYAFSWHATAILRFGGTLASMIAALLLVQGLIRVMPQRRRWLLMEMCDLVIVSRDMDSALLYGRSPGFSVFVVPRIEY